MGNMHAKKTAAHGFVNVIINTTIMWGGIISPKKKVGKHCVKHTLPPISQSASFSVSLMHCRLVN